MTENQEIQSLIIFLAAWLFQTSPRAINQLHGRVEMSPFPKMFREQNSPRFRWLCIVTHTPRTSVQNGHTLTLPYATKDDPHLFSPTPKLIGLFYSNGNHKYSPLHPFQMIVNSWVSAELQLFNTCVWNKTMSPPRKVHSMLQDHFCVLYSSEYFKNLNYSKPDKRRMFHL